MATRTEIEYWIAQAALGDRAGFQPLYDATSAKLFGLCLRVLGNRAEAEDTLQDVYIKIWRNADRYAANGLSPMTWLITIARNTAIDRLRARRSDRAEADDRIDQRPDPAPTPEDSAVARSELAALDACLEELDDARADAVRGAYLDGETYADLALRHEVPLNTMRTWLRRSLIRLRDCLNR